MRHARGAHEARAFLLCAMSAAQAGHAAEWRSSAIVRLDSAMESESRDLQKAQAVIDMEAGAMFDSGWSVTAVARVRGDTEDRLEPGKPDQRERSSYNRRWLLGETADAELRELYLDGHLGRAFIRIGKQQVVWGQADGLRVLDVVNPFSFREFVWPDPQDRRMPLWTVKTEVPVGQALLQLLWIPDPTYDDIPLGDASFAVTTPLLVPQAATPIDVMPTQRPSDWRDGSDAGARVSALIGGWDITLNYLYHYYDDPAPFVGFADGASALTPRYERSRLFGTTWSNAFGSTTVRGEVGYSTDRWFLTNDAADPDRVFSSDEIAFVVGIDNTAIADTLLSLQYFQSTLQQPVAFMTRSREERQATALLQKSFRNDSVKLRALWLYSLNRGDGGIQVRLSWLASASFSVGVSFERFYGDPNGLFGEFRDASRAGIDLQWSWSRAQ